MKYSKEELEKLISEKKTLGVFIFDEKKQQFTSDVEICLTIRKVEEGLYRAVSYYFDGYEFWVEDKINLFFEGNQEQAMKKAIKSWNEYNPESFMEYPIIYTNVICAIYYEPK
ncbi:hypothetical protein [Bernardetia sp.]|uniref:hypothetical protein n=1 Tax=Bernardetia sp. TaxID=1937974 RepID=UPI0025BD23AE|nr:hypothetical protein [Bernardetia sp.]